MYTVKNISKCMLVSYATTEENKKGPSGLHTTLTDEKDLKSIIPRHYQNPCP